MTPAASTPVPNSGVLVPLVTPLSDDRTVDTNSLGRLTEHVLAAGVAGVLVLGSSGEGGALENSERLRAIAAVVEAVGGRAHVMAGVPALGTAEAIRDARAFAALNVDSLLVAGPFMFEPSPDELRGHFRLAAAAVDIPIIAYDVPARAHVKLSADLLAGLAAEGAIVGVKDSTNDLSNAPAVLAATRDILDFVRLTGSEEAIDGLLLSGYEVAVPGLANLVPQLHVELVARSVEGDWQRASMLQTHIATLLDLYTPPLEGASPVARFFAATKEALRQMGIITWNTTSEPFVQADDGVRRHVETWLERLPARV
jgi:4-hydroxy-tetrahydrodipicolinate synthase